MEEAKKITSEFAIVSLVLALISLVNLFNMEKAIAAIVFGALALRRMAKDERLGGKKLAIAGIIIAIAALILIIRFIVKYYPQIQEVIKNAVGK